MIKYYSIGGLNFRFDSDSEIADSSLYSEFYSEKGGDDICVRVIEGKLPQIDDGRYASYDEQKGKNVFACRRRLDSRNYELFVDYPKGLWDSMLFYGFYLPGVLVENNRILLHCSYIIFNGEAVLFSGNKQVGKSTQASLWEKYRGAKVVNGDRAVVYVENGRMYAAGTPFCGSSNIALNITAPVKAVVFPVQSEHNETNEIKDKSTSLLLLMNQFTFDNNQYLSAFDIAKKITDTVPFYYLDCKIDEGAVETLESVLWKKK